MTFSVQPGSVNCNSSVSGPVTTLKCTSNVSVSANIGSNYWTSANNPNPNDSVLEFETGLESGQAESAVGFAQGTPSTLSPSPSPLPPYGRLSVLFDLNLILAKILPNDQLPSAFPAPPLPATAIQQFLAETIVVGPDLDAASGVTVSYTGQNCASPPSAGPAISTGGVVPVYRSVPTVQPGEWISIFGSNLANGTATWTGNFPTSLGSTSVTIDGKLAYLWFVSPAQINLQVPEDSNTGPVQVVVTSAAGSASASVTLAQFAPSFSLLDGTHVTGIILRANGGGAYGGGTYDIVGPTGNSLGYPTVAAKAGDSIELFAVGLGPTNPTVAPGQVFSSAAPTTTTVSVNIGGTTVYPSFSGLSSAGLYQINLTIPSRLATGDVPLQATVGGVSTQSGVLISLQ